MTDQDQPRQPSRKRRFNSKAMRRQIIERIAGGEKPPAEIAADLDVDLNDLASLARHEATMQTLEGLARLQDVRAQMLLSKYRANVAMHLLAIASAKEPTELSRKACVDMLKTDLNVFAHGDDGNSSADASATPAVPDEKAILQALERIGEADA
jgi:hypothetical protein